MYYMFTLSIFVNGKNMIFVVLIQSLMYQERTVFIELFKETLITNVSNCFCNRKRNNHYVTRRPPVFIYFLPTYM